MSLLSDLNIKTGIQNMRNSLTWLYHAPQSKFVLWSIHFDNLYFFPESTSSDESWECCLFLSFAESISWCPFFFFFHSVLEWLESGPCVSGCFLKMVNMGCFQPHSSEKWLMSINFTVERKSEFWCDWVFTVIISIRIMWIKMHYMYHIDLFSIITELTSVCELHLRQSFVSCPPLLGDNAGPRNQSGWKVLCGNSRALHHLADLLCVTLSITRKRWMLERMN